MLSTHAGKTMMETTLTSTCRLAAHLDTGPKTILQAKPLRGRFEKTAEAFNAEHAAFRKKAWEKLQRT